MDDLGTREIQAQAMMVQDKTSDAVARTRRMVEETIDVSIYHK